MLVAVERPFNVDFRRQTGFIRSRYYVVATHNKVMMEV
jgi:hypothetical protein